MKGVVPLVRTPDGRCASMDNSDSFHSHVTKKYKITFTFNCNSSIVVYLFDCVVCAFQ